jgi:hypothetical protein
MLEVYSKNVNVAANGIIPLTTVALLKGTSTQLLGTSTIQFNKCGVYEVSVSGSVIGSAAGEIIVQLEKNGVAQPQAVSLITAADATSQIPFSFTTLVQVPDSNNINCPCSTTTTIDLRNAGIEAIYSTIDVTAVRI